MSSEAEIIIAFLYKRSGKSVLTEPELYLSLSMDLGWMTATEAKDFVQHIQDDKLVHPHDNGLAPAFEIAAVNIPRGFTPSKKTRSKETHVHTTQESLLDQIVKCVSEYTRQPVQQITSETVALAAEKNVVPEVAVLWIAHRHDCDVSTFYDAVEAHLKSPMKKP